MGDGAPGSSSRAVESPVYRDRDRTSGAVGGEEGDFFYGLGLGYARRRGHTRAAHDLSY
jgi:hypothetical protein